MKKSPDDEIDYILRGMNRALWAKVKAKAALRQESIRDVIVRLLTKFAE